MAFPSLSTFAPGLSNALITSFGAFGKLFLQIFLFILAAFCISPHNQCVHTTLSVFQLNITSVFLKTLNNVYSYFFLCWSFCRPLWRQRLNNPVGFIEMWLQKQTSLLEEFVQERAGPEALTLAPVV